MTTILRRTITGTAIPLLEGLFGNNHKGKVIPKTTVPITTIPIPIIHRAFIDRQFLERSIQELTSEEKPPSK